MQDAPRIYDAPRYAGLFGRDEGTPDSFWISLRYFNIYRMAVAALFLGITLLLGVVFHSLLRNLRDLFNLQLSAHLALDIVAITLLMYASGGIRSGLGVMLLIALTGAALVAPRRLSLLYAALAGIALLLEQSYWVLKFDAPEANYLQPALLAIGGFAGAGMVGWLAQRVAANESLARQRGQALETQLRVNQLVIADMQDGVMVLDRDGRVAQHNPQAQRLLGAGALRGAELARLLPGFGERWRAWRGGDGSAARSEFDLRGRGLRLRLMETGAAEQLAVLFVEDTTRSRDEAQQLKLAALGRLTANIAHEIRNPLSAISHAAELLKPRPHQRRPRRAAGLAAGVRPGLLRQRGGAGGPGRGRDRARGHGRVRPRAPAPGAVEPAAQRRAPRARGAGERAHRAERLCRSSRIERDRQRPGRRAGDPRPVV